MEQEQAFSEASQYFSTELPTTNKVTLKFIVLLLFTTILKMAKLKSGYEKHKLNRNA